MSLTNRQAISKYPYTFLKFALNGQDIREGFKHVFNIERCTLGGISDELLVNAGTEARAIPLHALFMTGFIPGDVITPLPAITIFIQKVFKDLDFQNDLTERSKKYLFNLDPAYSKAVFGEDFYRKIREYRPGDSDIEGYAIITENILEKFITYLISTNSAGSLVADILRRRKTALNTILLETSMGDVGLNAFYSYTRLIPEFFITDSERMQFRDIQPTTLTIPGGSSFLEDFTMETLITEEIFAEDEAEPYKPTVSLHPLLAEGYTTSKLSQKIGQCYGLYKGKVIYISEYAGDNNIKYHTMVNDKCSSEINARFSNEFILEQPVLGFINTEIGVLFTERRYINSGSSRYKIAFTPDKIKIHKVHDTPNASPFRKVFRDKLDNHSYLAPNYIAYCILKNKFFTLEDGLNALLTGKRIGVAITEDIALVAHYSTNSILVYCQLQSVGYYNSESSKLNVHESIREFCKDLEVVYVK